MTDLRIPVAAKTLLDFIIKTETGETGTAAYNTLFGHNERRWTPALTNMTIDEAIAAGRTWTRRWKSSAAGGPQFMRNTLIALKDDLGLTGKEKLTPELQDFMGFALLKRRGYRSFLNGTLSRTEFGKRLAQEWASFPVLAACTGKHRRLKRGQSFYAGDSLNKALITAGQVEGVLDDVLRVAKVEKKPVETQEPPAAPKPAPVPPSRPAAPADGKATEIRPVPVEVPGLDKPLPKSTTFWATIVGLFTSVIGALQAIDWRVTLALIVVAVGVAIWIVRERRRYAVAQRTIVQAHAAATDAAVPG